MTAACAHSRSSLSPQAIKSHGQAAQQGQDQEDDQDQADQAAACAKDGVPAPEAVATAQQGQDQNHNKDKYDRTHGSLLTNKEQQNLEGSLP